MDVIMYGGDGNGGKTRRRVRNTTILDLEDDILAFIFTRLSVSTILECKTVCKSFYVFLSSPFFAESYQSNPPFTCLIIHKGLSFFLLQLNSGYKPKLLPDPFGLSHCGRGTRFLVGSCNGFFCYSDKDVLYVTNPLSGAHIKLPEEEVLDVSTRTYGFGYCPQTQHYKLVQLATFLRPCSRTEVHVFTVGVDKFWRKIHSPFQHIQQPRLSNYNYHTLHFLEVNGKGALHWIVDDPDMNRLDHLYSFDITEETVRPIPPPVGLETRNKNTLLFSVHSRLCLLHMNDGLYEQNVQLWCMTEYMDQSSWMLRIISGTSLRQVLSFTRHQSVAFGKNDHDLLMVLQPYGITCCNLQQTIFHKLDIVHRGHYDRDVTFFVPNFFSRTIQGGTKVDDAAARKLGLLLQKKSEPTQVGNDCARITDNILLSRDAIRLAKTNSMPSSSNTVSLILCDKSSPRSLFTLEESDYLSNNVEAFAGTPSSSMASSMAKVTVLGSCNGLVCLSALNDDQTYTIYICNPVVREIAILPQPKGDKRIHDEAYAFGYSCVSGHYKVLRILTGNWCPGKFEAYALTIGIDNEWRGVVKKGGGEIRMPKKFSPNINKARFCDVPFNNAIHWVGVGDSQLIIYAFDIDEERFTSLAHLPSVYNIRHDLQPCLGILRDCLCLCVMNPRRLGYVDLWSMRSYGSRASWARKRILLPTGTIAPANAPTRFTGRVRLPVTSWKDGEIIMWVEDCGGTLMSYCLRNGKCTEIKIRNGAYSSDAALIAVPYVPSCLSLRDAVKNGNLEVNKMEVPFKIDCAAPQIAPAPIAQNSPLVQNEANLMAGNNFPDANFNDDDAPQAQIAHVDMPYFFYHGDVFQPVPVGQEITDVEMIKILSNVQLVGIYSNHPDIQLIEANFYRYHPDDLLAGAYYITECPQHRTSQFGTWESEEERKPVINPGIEHPIGYTRRLSYKLGPLKILVGYRMTEYTLRDLNLSLWGNPPPLVMCRITKKGYRSM